MPRLFVLSGDDLGRTFDFEGAVVLGRGDRADLRLRATSVSRAHARIEPDGAGWRLVDLGSRNGVTMNFQRVEAAPLVDGAVFLLGDLELRFRLDAERTGPSEARQAAPAAPVAPAPVEAEIELEGDWETVVPPPPSRLPSAAPVDLPTVTPAGRPAPTAREARRAEARAALGGAPARAAAATLGQRPVLQYHRQEGAGGLLGGDLAQRPWWVRTAVWTLALALLVGLAWGALRLTRQLRASEAALSSSD